MGLQVNEQQSLGLDLNGNPGAAMFRFGAASGLPVLAANPSSANTGSAVISVTPQPPAALTAAGVSSVQASDYRLTADGLGGFQLARLKDGELDPDFAAQSVVNGDLVDGFKISISGAAAAGDTFLLRPAGSAARDMQLNMTNPKLLAAAAPLSATLGSTNTGTGAVGVISYASTDVAAYANLPVTLRFQTTSVPGQFTYTWTDSAGTGVPNTWSSGQPIAYPGTTPTNGFSVQINGVPTAANSSASPAVSSDTFVFSANAYPGSDNRNANALLALRDNPLVGAIWSGGTLQQGANVTEAYAGIVASIGVRVQSAKSSAELSSGVAAEAELARSSKSGVNLDEEAARLIQYQQTYQAAAKMLQVAQTVFDTLLQATAR